MCNGPPKSDERFRDALYITMARIVRAHLVNTFYVYYITSSNARCRRGFPRTIYGHFVRVRRLINGTGYWDDGEPFNKAFVFSNGTAGNGNVFFAARRVWIETRTYDGGLCRKRSPRESPFHRFSDRAWSICLRPVAKLCV